MPGDVFSQATHHLMRNKKITPDLAEASFRPTLLPQRTTLGRRTSTTGRRIGGRRPSPRNEEEPQTTAWTRRENTEEARTTGWTSTNTQTPTAPSFSPSDVTEKEEVGVTEQQVIKEFVEDFKEKELKKEAFHKRKQHFLSPEERRISGSRRREEEREKEEIVTEEVESGDDAITERATTLPGQQQPVKRGRFILAIGANGKRR